MRAWVLIAIVWIGLVVLADYCVTGFHDDRMDYISGGLVVKGAALFVFIGIIKSAWRS